MARYLVATHHASLTRDWLCKHCHGYGHATVRAKGRAEHRLWFSRDAAAEKAHADAAAALESDADRIVSLIRCPLCGRRAPGAALATAWKILPDLFPALAGVGIVVVFCAEKDISTLFTLLACALVLVLVLAIGNERRRWRQAARADLRVRTDAPKRRAPIERAPRAAATDPYRAPPAPPPVAIVRPPVQAAAPTVRGDGTDKPPTFLV